MKWNINFPSCPMTFLALHLWTLYSFQGDLPIFFSARIFITRKVEFSNVCWRMKFIAVSLVFFWIDDHFVFLCCRMMSLATLSLCLGNHWTNLSCSMVCIFKHLGFFIPYVTKQLILVCMRTFVQYQWFWSGFSFTRAEKMVATP